MGNRSSNWTLIFRDVPSNQEIVRHRSHFQMEGHRVGPGTVFDAVHHERYVLAGCHPHGLLLRWRHQPRSHAR